MSASIVRIHNLTVQFPGGVPVFANISFEIPRNCIFGIFGETGCGKSTLAQCCAGFIPENLLTGTIIINFENYSVDVRDVTEIDWRNNLRGRKIVYIPQDPYKTLNPHEKIGTQLTRVIEIYRNTNLEEICRKIGLNTYIIDYYPHMLSAGQRQRILFGFALAIMPRLLILDEPTASLDVDGRAVLHRLFKELQNNKVTLIIISHEIDEYRTVIAEENRFYFSPIAGDSSQYQRDGKNTGHNISTPLLKLSHLCKYFDGAPVLYDVNWQIYPREWIYLSGSNGCGKSTLLKIILGHLAPDAGNLEWLEASLPWNKIHKLSQYIHPVFQDAFYSLNPKLTVRDCLQEVIHLATGKRRLQLENHCRELWQRLALDQSLAMMLPQQLSYGQQKRIVFVRCLLKYYLESLRNPDAWHLFLFDEVFAGINWELRQSILEILEPIRHQNCAVVWVAHGCLSLRNLCSREFHLQNGELTACLR